jgi:regulator of PEP synthase PpsR (kinase-PPPase family)
VHWAEALYRAQGIPSINTTAMSIEEIAAAIVHGAGIRRRF